MFNIADLNEEDRQRFLAAARQKAAEKREAWKARAHLLIQKFSDEANWWRLASKFGMRMPPAYIPAIDGLRYARKAIKKTGIDFVAINGTSLKGWCAMNPEWPAYALVGLILEDGAELQGMAVPEQESDFSDVEDLI